MAIKLPKKSQPGKGDLPETAEEWIEYVNECHDLLLNQRRDQERQWTINLAAYLGHQNLVYDRVTSVIDFDRTSTPLVVNRIGSFLESRLAKLTKNRPISRVLPNTNDAVDRLAAKYSDRLLTYLWSSTDMEAELTRAIIYMLAAGTSFIKTVWDPDAGDSISQDKIEQTDDTTTLFLDEQSGGLEQEKIFMGDVVSKGMSPFSLLVPNQSVTKLESQPYLIERLFMPIIDAEGRWSHLQGKIQPEQDTTTKSQFERIVSSLASTIIPSSTQQVINKKDSLNQECLVKIMCIKPNWQYEKGVIIAVIGKELANATEFPNDYGNAIYPYVKLQERDDGYHFWQQSTIERLIPINKAMNRLKEQKARNAALMANLKWLVPKGAGLPDISLDDTEGEIVPYDPNFPAPRPADIQGLPAYVTNFDSELKADFRDVGGQLETSVSPPPQLTAGVALQAFSELSEEGLIPIIRMLANALEKVSNTQLMIVNDEYIEPRKIKIIGNEGQVSVDYIAAQDLKHNTDVHIEIESLIPTLRSQKVQRLFDMWDRRVITDPNDFFDMLRFGNFDQVMDKRDASKETVIRDIEAMKKGKMASIEQFQNHMQYVQMLSDFLQTNEFAQLIPERKELFTQAIQQHLQYLIPTMQGNGAPQMQTNPAAVNTPFGPATPPGAPGAA